MRSRPIDTLRTPVWDRQTGRGLDRSAYCYCALWAWPPGSDRSQLCRTVLRVWRDVTWPEGSASLR